MLVMFFLLDILLFCGLVQKVYNFRYIYTLHIAYNDIMHKNKYIQIINPLYYFVYEYNSE